MTNYILVGFVVFNTLWIIFMIYGINSGWVDDYLKKKD